ncbi:hypothetical protein [Streptomyces sp. NPDC056188]|uniref:hypothetical protein n=1 Tax=Streptomyces sp. NPDC056188 TaxID=3345740 RepID=UPI0035DFDAC7
MCGVLTLLAAIDLTVVARRLGRERDLPRQAAELLTTRVAVLMPPNRAGGE